MKKYKELYTKDAKGAIRVWYMEQDGEKYRTIHGILNGQMVTSEFTTAIAKNVGKKNEYNATEQASNEIASQYRKQLKSGYAFTIKDIKEPYFKPMLACNYEDYKSEIDWKSIMIVQPKLNGIRMIAQKHGCFSRKGERFFTIAHIESKLKPFFEEYPEAVLDGEIYNHGLANQLNVLNSIVRKTKNISEEDLKKSEELAKYVIFDGVLNKQSLKLSYQERYFEGIMGIGVRTKIPLTVNIQEIESRSAWSDGDVEIALANNINKGYEGIIIRNARAPYENKRSRYLLKYKPVDDDEAVILNIEEGEGNWSKTGKTITLKWGNKEFRASFKGTYEQCEQFWKDKDKWMGRIVKFHYNGLTGLGTPNFARVDIDNCTPDK